ncbi:mRNA cleavage and polyadenylation specificity factor complex subunit [Coccidioides immitis RS]|uniref:mRNA cleavage and polyadenylation specificity factor complex subunit n=2 Tax=Coccidioides immitis TaxID=5501 RepID=J3KKW1_COCIM|nr:mRNA cleavage and polyadenylation specificity factor complex subunit [Coccidioides immitis RS]EAS36853.3 mRNA cleavage and polyadenylation specificity factor complex subunit [Coccidioides immitis RS]KMP09760.1 hypothetical protein CIRG_08993 [Coccidioides immitis RMSCC 2394]
MALPVSSLVEQMSQLDAARNLVLGDAALYPQIVHGIIPIIGPNSRLELRRWGAEFLAETFASPAFPQPAKQKLATEVLATIQDLLSISMEDTAVLKGAIQASASVYSLVFRYIIDHPEDSTLWERMTAIKHAILRKWDATSPGVKICCIKFAQRVVQAQTQGVISDPRRPEKNEISLALVPKNHPLIPIPNLEAEASGLLDRLLNVFHENSSDPLLVNATLNSLAVLIRMRPSISNKIINAILSFNPLKQANAPMTPTARVNIKSMERTTRALLVNLLKRNPSNPLAGRIQQYIERMAQSRNEIFEEATRKRALPTEPTDLVDSAKRARLGVNTPPQLKIPPLPPGPTSFAQLFTLTEDAGLTSFDVKQLPLDLLVKITVPILNRIDAEALDQAIGAVRNRHLTLCKKQVFEHQAQAQQVQPPAEEEEDEYEPEYEPMDIPAVPVSQPLQTEPEGAGAAEIPPDLMTLGPFVLPQPLPLSETEAAEVGKEAVQRVFNMASTLDQPSKTAKDSGQTLGFGRLAASSFDRDSWLTLLTRLATRASAGLEADVEEEVKQIENGNKQVVNPSQRPSLGNGIRELLYRYVLEDFRVRLNVAISWMNEEWYNYRVQLKYAAQQNGDGLNGVSVSSHYDYWVMRLLEGILPYLDARDKILIRFLSELPELNRALIKKVETLANDPERVNLCVQALHYLVLVRPPAKELCLDALEDLYKTVEEARPLITKILLKFRPEVLPEQPKQLTDNTKPQGQPQSTPDSGTEPGNTPRNSVSGYSSPGKVEGNATLSIPQQNGQALEPGKGDMPVDQTVTATG